MRVAAPFFCLGISHRSAPVHLRELLALPSGEQHSLLRRVVDSKALTGLVIVSTCNRVEFYGSASDSVATSADVLRSLLIELGRDPEPLDDRLFHLQGMEAAGHLARVTSGLDAMVLGESEILGQVDAAWRQSREFGASSGELDTLFHAALKAGRKARARTDINTNPVSVSSVAVRKAESFFGSLAGKRVAVVGLGDTGRLVTKVLRGKGTEEILFVNRTRSVAEDQAASTARARAYHVMDLPFVLERADAVFCCTGCPYPMVTMKMVERALDARSGRPLLLLDLAVPHDVEPASGDLAGVTILDVDAMEVEISDSLQVRTAAIPSVEALLEDEMARLERSLLEARVQPLITDLRRQADGIRQEEFRRLAQRLPDLPDDVLEQISHFSQALVQKLFHHPTTGIRQQASSGETEDLTRTVRELFQLHDRAN